MCVCSEVDNKLALQNAEYKELANVATQVENRRRALEEEKMEADEELDRQRSMLDEKTRELDMLTKDYELAKEREAVLMGDR